MKKEDADPDYDEEIVAEAPEPRAGATRPRRKRTMSPTQRTLRECRLRGWVPAVVERWNQWAPRGDSGLGVRRDLYGIVDIITIDVKRRETHGCGIIGIQSTGLDFAGHFRKLTIDCREASLLWLRSGASLQLWGWRKVKVGKGKAYRPRIHEFTFADFGIGGADAIFD